MASSGTTGVSTTTAASVALIALAGALYNFLTIRNEGANPGFFSVDGGNTWGRLPPAVLPFVGATVLTAAVVTWYGQSKSDVLIKRDGGSNMTGVYGQTDFLDFKL